MLLERDVGQAGRHAMIDWLKSLAKWLKSQKPGAATKAESSTRTATVTPRQTEEARCRG